MSVRCYQLPVLVTQPPAGSKGCRAQKPDLAFTTKGKAVHPDLKHKKRELICKAELAEISESSTFSWNKRLARSIKAGQYKKTMEDFEQMQQDGLKPDSFTFIPVLNACASLRDLECGRRVHTQIILDNCDLNMYVSCSLLDMYAKCGSIEDAFRVFVRLPKRDAVVWSTMILAYVKSGLGCKALELYRQMKREQVQPVRATFLGLLRACASQKALEEGRDIHQQIIQEGCESDAFVGSSLIDMYAKCGSIEDAERVFNEIPTRDVVCWNAMIVGYVKCGLAGMALKLPEQMLLEGLKPNSVTFVGVLNACGAVGALEQGKRFHEQIIESGCETDIFVASCLIDMYAKCGSMEDALIVFSKMPSHGVVAWNSLIMGFVKCGQGRKALDISKGMQKEGVEPDPVTFLGLLNACASLMALEEGRLLHEEIIQRRLESDASIGGYLLHMYVKCGSMEDAWRVFNRLPIRNVTAWNAMILGLVKCGQGRKALELSQQMQGDALEPNQGTFVGILNACASLGELERGRQIHEQVIQSGCECDAHVGSSLVDMYIKCGSMGDAWKVFNKMPVRNMYAWNAMILGQTKWGNEQKSLELYSRMQLEGVEPDSLTFVGVLRACANVGALEEGRHFHRQIIHYDCESDDVVGGCLVDMYAKCGSIEDAWRMFSKMPARSVFVWTNMIQGFVKCGQGRRALKLFHQMQVDGVEPDSVTFLGLLNACASLNALEDGRRVHEEIIQGGCESDRFVLSSLIDMYAKCGSLEDACRVFNKLPTFDVVVWTSMLGAYAMNGNGNEALRHFKQMCQKGIELNEVTLVSLLSACSHTGLVDEGLHYFESMTAIYRISPTVEHYVCMVDLLGRAGRLHEAENLIKSMPCEPNSSVWMSLLGSCRVHDNMEMGERIAKRVLALDPGDSAGYVLLSSIHAANGKWDSSAEIHRQRLGKGVKTSHGQLR